MKQLDSSRDFYKKHGAAMIHERFPEYEHRIAVGMVGEGSDCFGCDDAISADHDYGTGFCLWLTNEDYEAIGSELQRSYLEITRKLPQESRLLERRGVIRICDFYERLLGIPIETDQFRVTDGMWWKLDECQLAATTNGEVFRDDLGLFSEIRNQLLSYYPERIWRMRLVNQLHVFSATGQSNYARSMARNDSLTALLCKAKAIEAALDIGFLLNRTFGPYYKWKNRLLAEQSILSELPDLLNQIVKIPVQTDAWIDYKYDSGRVNHKDMIEIGFDTVGDLIRKELNRQGLSGLKTSFLEMHCREIAARI